MAKQSEEQARVCHKINGKIRYGMWLPIELCKKWCEYSKENKEGEYWIETRAEYEKKQREIDVAWAKREAEKGVA